ncbi:class I SAM-dependent methyltransferase [Agromyces fucosus]|uniref:Class I SAM-dependent methyltransferase n=1 Tax=Agromyces fucosus TaxID=41985 RepID=A0A4Q2JSF3_9MICO|nr:class I SAM-dependent methyltransferase [Agromyces fucosus]RXZ49417.1 class I SAM-dependent methyltransferase [Agromyces fucosus]
MDEVAYKSLASVYEWLVPDAKASPAGNAQTFETVTAGLEPGAQILDCACGIGLLAVGLAEAGFRVTACDASPAMVERTEALARAHGVEVSTRVCRWDELPDQGWQDRFDAVFCVGNSLAHAVGRSGRRAALDGMAFVLATGGVLTLTSRNWEQIRSGGSRLDVWDRLVERAGRKAVVVYSWQVPPSWDAEHHLQISVAALRDDDQLPVTTELLSMWPFRHDELLADVAAAGLSLEGSSYNATQPQYLVTARRPAAPQP